MYALFFIGSNLEPILGKSRFISAYVLAGILASVASLVWHKEGSVVSAGASGAIFGMYGVFLALLTTNLIPKHQRNRLLQSIVVFVAYNIFYGLKSNTGIDNAAHIGGLVSGMLIGYGYYLSLKPESAPEKTRTLTVVMAAATAAIVFFAVNQKQSDDMLFEKTQNEFAIAETEAMKAFEGGDASVEGIDNIMMPQWKKAKKIIDESADYKLNKRNSFIRASLQEYIDLRIKLTELARKAISENSTEYDKEANELADRINKVVDDLKNVPTDDK
jgi:rhomboid protease GluP